MPRRTPPKSREATTRIRRETPEDFASVHRVVSLAFNRTSEATLVETLRDVPGGISLVLETSGCVVGHVFFCPVAVDGPKPGSAVALAPLSVNPEFQRLGFGSALVRAGLEYCRRAGQNGVIVLGHPEYYRRFGFSSARAFHIAPPFEAPDDVWMALELRPGALRNVQGTVRYPEAFLSV